MVNKKFYFKLLQRVKIVGIVILALALLMIILVPIDVSLTWGRYLTDFSEGDRYFNSLNVSKPDRVLWISQESKMTIFFPFLAQKNYAVNGIYVPYLDWTIVCNNCSYGYKRILWHEIGHHVYNEDLTRKQIKSFKELFKDECEQSYSFINGDLYDECFAWKYEIWNIEKWENVDLK